MTNEKLISVFQRYLDTLTSMGVTAKQLDDYTVPASTLGPEPILSHLAYMCETAIQLVLNGRVDKAFRWLGFIQGVLWTADVYSVEDMKNHSRP